MRRAEERIQSGEGCERTGATKTVSALQAFPSNMLAAPQCSFLQITGSPYQRKSRLPRDPAMRKARELFYAAEPNRSVSISFSAFLGNFVAQICHAPRWRWVALQFFTAECSASRVCGMKRGRTANVPSLSPRLFQRAEKSAQVCECNLV
jgi:hypothetical protein